MTMHKKRHRTNSHQDGSSVLDMDNIHELMPPSNDLEREFTCVQIKLANSPMEYINELKEDSEKEIEILETEKEIEVTCKPTEGDPVVNSENKLEPRKSQRMRKIFIEADINAINCHQCKKIEITNNIITCGNNSCRESFCYNCLQKYFVT